MRKNTYYKTVTTKQSVFARKYVLNQNVALLQVQVRQKTDQRKTLFYLEQLLIKYEATRQCTGIKPSHEGLDFYFGAESGRLTKKLGSVNRTPDHGFSIIRLSFR